MNGLLELYNEYVENVAHECCCKIKNNEDIFITGRNMTGKSDILKYIITSSDMKDKLYFIDTVNRGIKNGDLLFDRDTMAISAVKILERRAREENFNTVDCFDTGEKNIGGEIAYKLLLTLMDDHTFCKKLKIFFEELPVEVQKNGTELRFIYNKMIVNLSSGYQALLRMFVEIYYINKKFNINVFVIDEIDMHLDNVMCRGIIRKLKECFENIVIVSTVHSINFFEENYNSNIIVLDGESYTFKQLHGSELGGLENIEMRLFKKDFNENYNVKMKKEIISGLKNKRFLTKKERVYLKKLKDNKLIQQLKQYEYYTTFENIRDKLFNGNSLNLYDRKFLNEVKDLTPDEENLKMIINTVLGGKDDVEIH